MISLCGAMTIVARGELNIRPFTSDLNVGDAWMLVAVLVWAIYTVGLAAPSRRSSDADAGGDDRRWPERC